MIFNLSICRRYSFFIFYQGNTIGLSYFVKKFTRVKVQKKLEQSSHLLVECKQYKFYKFFAKCKGFVQHYFLNFEKIGNTEV